MLKEKISNQLQKILEEMGVKTQDIASLQLEIPTDLSHGDYTTNIAMQIFKSVKRQASSVNIDSPMALAQLICDRLSVVSDQLSEIEKIDVAAPGFINFWISDKELLDRLGETQDVASLRSIKTKNPKTIIVEYSSPNIAKPFTVGHLRSTIIGDALANLLQAVGHTVKRDNHVGDWGTQFGKQIFALKYIRLKDHSVDISATAEILKENIQEIEHADRPVKLLVDLYIAFHEVAENKEHPHYNPVYEDLAREEFKQLETGNTQSRELWQKCIDWSWKEFDAIYQELDVHFTENNGRGYGESFFENKMMYVLDELKEKGFLTDGKEGAKIVEFSEASNLPPLMILKKDGATLYATRDLATDKFRLDEYGKDILIINEVGAEQSLYFQQIYTLESMLGWFKNGQRIHIKHGMYRFKEGKMSTRKGNVIWLEDVLANAIQQARHIGVPKDMQKPWEFDKNDKPIGVVNGLYGKSSDLPRKIGIGAIKWNDLKRSSHLDITFDWNDILNMQGNSGPYIQYTYARTQSILNKHKALSVKGEENITNNSLHPSPYTLNSDVLLYNKSHYETEEYMLIRQVYQFPEFVQKATESYSPNVVCEYLFTLAQQFNLFYQKYRILDVDEEEIKMFRLALTAGVGATVKKGLELLGIAAPTEM